jgi:hypothetical protein
MPDSIASVIAGLETVSTEVGGVQKQLEGVEATIAQFKQRFEYEKFRAADPTGNADDAVSCLGMALEDIYRAGQALTAYQQQDTRGVVEALQNK